MESRVVSPIEMHPRACGSLRILSGLFFLLVSCGAISLGLPIEPRDSALVIETLPAADIDADVRAMRARLAANADDWDALLALGNRYLTLAAKTGDERYLGYTTQLLQRAADDRPPAVATLQARLLQRQHRFAAALDVLEPLLRANPRDAEAHLLAAYILMAQGRADAALPHCRGAVAEAPVAGIHCAARAQALSGHSDIAYEKLSALMNSTVATADEQRDMALTLAEIAERRGRDSEAERHLLSVLKSDSRNTLALSRLADIYLRQRRYSDCWQLLRDNDTHAALLLRKTIAAMALGIPAATELRQRVQRNFEIENLRSETYASRDYSTYLLALAKRPQAAFGAALKNWETQRDPEDALAVLQAAACAGADSDRIAGIRQWIAQTRLEDMRFSAPRMHCAASGIEG